MNFGDLTELYLRFAFCWLVWVGDNEGTTLVICNFAFVIAAAVAEYSRAEELLAHSETNADRNLLSWSHFDRLWQHYVTDVVFHIFRVT